MGEKGSLVIKGELRAGEEIASTRDILHAVSHVFHNQSEWWWSRVVGVYRVPIDVCVCACYCVLVGQGGELLTGGINTNVLLCCFCA